MASFIIDNFTFAVGPSGYDRPCTTIFKVLSINIRIIAFVSDEILYVTQFIHQQFSAAHITDITKRKPEGEWATNHIGEDMEFASLTAPRRTDPLRFRPLFPPKAERCAFT